ncbi:MAG: beta-propeller fold lactonase family protein [Baekduiaceae bacterium]
MRQLSPQPAVIASSLLAVTLVLAPGAAGAQRPPVSAIGTITQVDGTGGCLVDRSAPRADCAPARALLGPAPFLGSHAVAISPDGTHVYVAASTADAIAVFGRSARTGRLTQAGGKAGCIAAKGANGCAWARGLNGPNSVAVTPDGRHVYATSLNSDDISVMRRNRTTGRSPSSPVRAGASPAWRRSPAAPADARSTARMSSPSAPTARTSTRGRSSGTPW